MPKFFIENKQINRDEIIILEEDVNHIKNVLRLKVGEEINICNSCNSNNYIAKIVNLDKERVICKIVKQIDSVAESKVYLHVLQGLPKSEKMELIIEKCVELGVKEITPVAMSRCVVKLDNKSKVKKIQRWRKISEIAAKQSGRDIIPIINNVIDLENIYEILKNYDIVLVAYENEKNNTLKREIINLKEQIDLDKKLRIAIIIGPEGGIEKKEVENLEDIGARIVSLGNRILRTETVALAVASIIMYEFDN